MTQRRILEFENVTKSFGGLKVIRDVSFTVEANSRTALIGPNGSGKTTTFNLISGVYPLDSGRIIADGVDISRLPARARIRHGIVRSFQNIRLMPHLSALENVMLGQHVSAGGLLQLVPLASSSGGLRRQALEALARVGLGTYEGQTVSNLPYGVQKRIEVARALVGRPKLLLLDEPAAGLNNVETNEMNALLRSVADSGVTLLVVEHDMGFVRTLCERVIVIDFGSKIAEGTPAEIARDPKVIEAYLGVDEEAPVATETSGAP